MTDRLRTQVEARFIVDVISALESDNAIGQRSCRPGDGLNYAANERLIAEARRILSDTREEEDGLRAAADDIYRIIGNEIGHGRGTDALEAISRRLSAALSPQPTKEAEDDFDPDTYHAHDEAFPPYEHQHEGGRAGHTHAQPTKEEPE